jgi:uncharacterized protein YndB with AHSA1/START domain
MPVIRLSQVIDRPAGDVFRALADVSNLAVWNILTPVASPNGSGLRERRWEGRREPGLGLVSELAPRLKKVSKHMVADTRPNGGSLSRIYRDTPFPKDKSPYKTALFIHRWHDPGTEDAAPAFYPRRSGGAERRESHMPVDVTTEIVIDRPPAVVARFAREPENAPSWYVNIKSTEWKTPPPLSVGSRVAFVAHFLGRRLAYTYEIVELEPESRLVMRTSEGPFPMETTYTWQPLPDGRTKMTLRNRGEPSGFGALFAPLMATAMRRANRKDLALLKSILESA